MTPSAVSIAVSRLGAAPVAGQRRIEHVAEPVHDHRLRRLATGCGHRRGRSRPGFADAGQRARGHQDELAAELLDRFHLLFVAANHVVDDLASSSARWSVPQPEATSAPGGLGRVERAAYQFERGRPVQAHAALRGVHRFGHAQAQRPQVAPVGDGGVPVDRAGQPRIHRRQRVGHDVRGGIGDAVEARLPGAGWPACAAQR
jgi:hypothetical protein